MTDILQLVKQIHYATLLLLAARLAMIRCEDGNERSLPRKKFTNDLLLYFLL
jgi:hypothetical protein